MRKRIRCIFHAESTPSLILYKDSFKCFGCGKRGPLTELPEDLRPKEGEILDEEPEDVAETFKYINALPQADVRGLRLPSDDRGYFIVWPNAMYYKYRLHNPGKTSKYLGPKGIKPPLFWAKRKGNKTLVIVEGELNAMSISLAFPEYDVCSPGSASMFNADNLTKYLTEFSEYANVIVIMDEDAAGIKGLIEAKAFLLYKLPFTSFLLMSTDANAVLQEEGPENLRKRVQGGHYR